MSEVMVTPIRPSHDAKLIDGNWLVSLGLEFIDRGELFLDPFLIHPLHFAPIAINIHATRIAVLRRRTRVMAITIRLVVVKGGKLSSIYQCDRFPIEDLVRCFEVKTLSGA